MEWSSVGPVLVLVASVVGGLAALPWVMQRFVSGIVEPMAADQARLAADFVRSEMSANEFAKLDKAWDVRLKAVADRFDVMHDATERIFHRRFDDLCSRITRMEDRLVVEVRNGNGHSG